MNFQKRPLIIVFVVFFSFAIIQLATSAWGDRFVLNLSSSEPLGLYLLRPFSGIPKKGELVLMHAPERAKKYIYSRYWLPEGWPLLKTVGAVTGDTYCITEREFTVNGAYIGPVFDRDSQGFPLPRLRGCRQVGADHFLPVATNTDKSFDGRYFGAVSTSEIRALAVPVFIF